MSNFTIRNVQSRQNLTVDRSREDLVTLLAANPAQETQQWTQIQTSTGVIFRNPGSGYLKPDDRFTNPKGLRVHPTDQFVWTVMPITKPATGAVHHTIRPATTGRDDLKQNIKMAAPLMPVILDDRTSSDDDTYFWDIVPLGS